MQKASSNRFKLPALHVWGCPLPSPCGLCFYWCNQKAVSGGSSGGGGEEGPRQKGLAPVARVGARRQGWRLVFRPIMPNCQQPLPSLPVGFKEDLSLLESQIPLSASGTQNSEWLRVRRGLYPTGQALPFWCPLERILRQSQEERPWRSWQWACVTVCV